MSQIDKQKIQDICVRKIIPLWYAQPETFPAFLNRPGDSAREENETLLCRYLPLIREKLDGCPKNDSERTAWKNELEHLIREFARQEHIIGIAEYMDENTFFSFESETKRIIGKMRRFDSSLSADNIWQAVRNYFIYAIILHMEGKKQDGGDAVLAYSLLYPYTDNFIDDKRKTDKEKAAYNKLIRDAILGLPTAPRGILEEKTVRLLGMMQKIYSGDNGNETGALLLLMLDAQQESLKQQRNRLSSNLPEEDILRISTYKGGMSVLVDEYLAIGSLEETELEFYLKFGFILQLADDLQDLDEDKKNRSSTIMTRAVKTRSLEQNVNRLLHFIRCAVSDYRPKNLPFREFVMQNCLLMTVANIFTCKKYFSEPYLEAMEQYLPVSGSFLQDAQRKNKKSISFPENPLELLDIFIPQ